MCKINCSGGCQDCAPDEHLDALPPVNRRSPQTLILNYGMGIQIRVPYLDRKGSKAYIQKHLDTGVPINWKVVDYTGE